MLLPIGLYILLKTNAVGLNSPQHGAPIDNLGLIGRLFTDPSIILFYLTKFIFPWKLASGYYWTYPTFSVRHVLLPLVVDIAVIGLFVYLGKRVKNKLSAAKHRAYLFFAVWAVVGMLPYLQIIPLDMTACETWFYLSMAGMLGMIGIIFLTIKIRVQPLLFLLVAVVIIGLLGVRTAIRGTDYRSQYILARDDLKVSTDDYSAMNDISEGLITDKNYKQAAVYAKESAVIFPTVSNYNNLGVSLEYSENFPGAVQAYNQALKYGSLSITYENLAEITLVYGTPNSDLQLFEKAIKAYPHDSKIWLYLAVDEDAAGSSANARAALSYAVKYGQIPQTLYNDIYSGQPFALSLPIYNKALEIR
jgi:hypothetical protein